MGGCGMGGPDWAGRLVGDSGRLGSDPGPAPGSPAPDPWHHARLPG